MQFNIDNIEELEDGSATINITMDNETREFLINVAVLHVLQTAVDDFNKRFPNDIAKTIQTSIKGDILKGKVEKDS